MNVHFTDSETHQTGCLLLHGLTGSPDVLYELGNHLSRLDIKVSIPLLPGHGTSLRSLKKTKWESWYQTAEDAFLELSSSCKIVFFVGFSMGGALALLLASQYSPKGLIVLSAPVRLNPLFRYILPVAKYILPYWKKNWQPYYRKQRHNNNNVYDAYPLATVQQLDTMLRKTRTNLEKIICPAMLIHGFRDKRVSFHNASIINALISSTDKRMIFIDDSKHTITQSKYAAEVFKSISDFIMEQSKK